MDIKTLSLAAFGVVVLTLLILIFVFRPIEPYKADKTNTAFNNSPKFWNWKNIKNLL
jgi:hypothetical protein